jgi:hypothetical protein
MATAPQEPGRLNFSFVRGEVWSKLVDFSDPSDVTGYTFEAGLYSPVTGSLAQAITTTVVSAATGQVNLALTAVQTAALPAGTYEFRMTWGPVSRRIYQGFCEVLP